MLGKSTVSVPEDLSFLEGLALRTGAAADILELAARWK
jgi:hypothetical protein